MTDLKPFDKKPLVMPRLPDVVNQQVQSAYEKARVHWGIPNNLIRTMGAHPGLVKTEIDYINSVAFDEGQYTRLPNPDKHSPLKTVLFPVSGFVDRVTKELVISLVSLVNRSRYSITHHTVIGYLTLSQLVEGKSASEKAQRAEQLLLKLVDETGQVTFEGQFYQGKPLYSQLQIALMRFCLQFRNNVHAMPEVLISEVKQCLRDAAEIAIKQGPLASQFTQGNPSEPYLDAYVDAMLIEVTWCVAHFAGLLNDWMTFMRLEDETFVVDANGDSFVSSYNKVVPESIKVRNNGLI